MQTLSKAFYGCLCFETYSSWPSVPAAGHRRLSAGCFPEIHFNIWEKGVSGNAFLDIGLMLEIGDPAEKIEIFLPWNIEKSSIDDLAHKVFIANGAQAIFNEAWTSTSGPSSTGGFVTRSDGTIFSVVPYNTTVVMVRTLGTESLHSIVIDVSHIRASSVAITPNADKMYVRFRVNNVPPSFYQVGINSSDAFGGATLNRTEIIDFRLNVRRGVPFGMEQLVNGRFMEFSKVHLFLMKSRHHDIVFEDKLFAACRSLEDEKFWADYIVPLDGSNRKLKKCTKHVKSSLGYQWRKISATIASPVAEFGMLARFKSFGMNKFGVIFFIILALFIGVAGNWVYDLIKAHFAAQ